MHVALGCPITLDLFSVESFGQPVRTDVGSPIPIWIGMITAQANEVLGGTVQVAGCPNPLYGTSGPCTWDPEVFQQASGDDTLLPRLVFL